MDWPLVIPIDHKDPRVLTAAQCEASLFEHYGLKPRERVIRCESFKLRLRVAEVGEGPPLILVPGGGGELFQYIPMMAALTGFHLIAIDLPGGGKSDTVDHRRVDLRELARATLQALVDSYEFDVVPFVTNSRGAQWTLWFAQSCPDRVASMVHTGCPALILGTSAPLPMRLLSVAVLNRLLFAVAHARRPDQVKATLAMLGTGKAALDALPDVFFETACAMFNLPNYRLAWLSFLEAMLRPWGPNPDYVTHAEELRSIGHRIDLIWGRNDPFGGLDIAARVAEAFPHAALHEVDAGHLPPFDDPAGCARLVRKCLD